MFKRTLLIALILILLVTCLPACSKEVNVDDPTMLELPGIKWNSTPEEVKEALKLTEEQILLDQQKETNGEDNAAWILCITDVSFFTETLLMGQFTFVRYNDYEKFGLESVHLYYPDDIDMTAIRDNLTDLYGAGSAGMGNIQYRIIEGELESYTESMISTTSFDDQSEVMAKWWSSTAKYVDVLPSDVQEKITSMFNDPKYAAEYLTKQSAVTLACTNSMKEGASRNCVVFAANEYIALVQDFCK